MTAFINEEDINLRSLYNCDGCRGWSDILNRCRYSKSNIKYIKNCPCEECIVKMTCEVGSKISSCKPFSDKWHKTVNIKQEEEKYVW